MAALLVDTGLELALKLLTNQESPMDLYLHLFTAAHTPAVTDITSDYLSMEPDPMTGYSPFLFDATSWYLNVTSGIVSLLYPPISFVFTSGPFNVHGFFVTEGMDGDLIFADELATPIAVAMDGTPEVPVSVQLQSKNCP